MATASFTNSPYNKEGEILVHFTTCEMPRVVDMTKLSVCMFYTDLYDKRDTFSFSIVNFPHMDSNIPSKPAYGVAISVSSIFEDML